jgi:hypothetical protein
MSMHPKSLVGLVAALAIACSESPSSTGDAEATTETSVGTDECTVGSSCGAGSTCGFAIGDGCAAKGHCISVKACPKEALVAVCACGRGNSLACNGYAAFPIEHAGACMAADGGPSDAAGE